MKNSIDYSNVLFRCHRLSDIMFERGNITDTCKKYLAEVDASCWKKEEVIIGDDLLNGIFSEKDSITLYSKYKKIFFIENEERFENEYLTGKPDIIHNDTIIDIKTCKNLISFNKKFIEKLSKVYYWQLQGYMYLTDLKKAKLVYCLPSVADQIVVKKINNILYNFPENEHDGLVRKVESLCNNEDLPMYKRIYEIDIERNEDDINRIGKNVEICRDFMKKTWGYNECQTIR